MKKIKSSLFILFTSLFLVSCTHEVATATKLVTPTYEDDLVYEEAIEADINKPDYSKGKTKAGSGDDDDDEEEEIIVNKVVINYVNDDNDCNNRAFYIWVTGVDGKEYSNTVDGGAYADVVKYDASGAIMTITMDFADSRFSYLSGATSLMYIIKYKMKSTAELNWGGQSEDVELKYADFPPVDGTVTVWCTPSASGGIAQFKTKAETSVDGVMKADFTDWNTISCINTVTSKEVKWTLYAFDETYYKIKPRKRGAVKNDYIIKTGSSKYDKFEIKLDYNAHINVVYSIVSKDTRSKTNLEKTIYVSFEKLYRSERFNALYSPNELNYAAGNERPLGMTYTPEKTTFRVWSPVSALVTLLVYGENGTSTAFDPNSSDAYDAWYMHYTKEGIWELTVKGDLKGKYYNFLADTWNASSVAMDPYATACGACGLRALVYDNEETNPDNWDLLPTKWDGDARYDLATPQDLAIYEVHVQDFTGDASWQSNKGNKNGTYNAFVERGTTYTAKDMGGTTRTVSTGFDHIKELGVNAVQFVPVFDSDNDETAAKPKYNWGYNPLNYNCVEGIYSSDPYHGEVRVKEFKNMIYQLATIDCRTIMDVVYNHVSSPTASCFNKLMPRYYFRYAQEGDKFVTRGWQTVGELYDGSGCHNEFRSEAVMARKFIVDSVCMWAKEYKIKGFRFDLMGLIDVETMRAVKKALYKIDPDIYLYGEGWTADRFHGGLDYVKEGNNLKLVESKGAFAVGPWGEFPETVGGSEVYLDLDYNHYDSGSDTFEGPSCYLGAFNAQGREAIKGDNGPGYGYASQGDDSFFNEGNRDKIKDMVSGSYTGIGGNPKQTINYVSCHDDYSVADQFYITLGDGTNGANVEDVAKASQLAHALVFASNSAAFMLGGEELLRTKEVLKNSPDYDFDDVKPNTYHEFAGKVISHNSYDSPIQVNSFKWGNKITASYYGQKLDAYTWNMTNQFKRMIEMHKRIGKSDSGSIADIHFTGSGNRTIFCLSISGFFVYAFGRTGGTYGGVGFDPNAVDGIGKKRLVFDCNVYKDGETLSSGQYGVWVYNNN